MSWFTNLRVQLKILVGVGVVLAMTLTVGLVGVRGLSSVGAKTTDVSQNWMPSVGALKSLQTAIAKYRTGEYRALMARTPEESASATAVTAQNTKAFNTQSAAYEKLISSKRERAMWNSFNQDWAKYQAVHKQIASLSADGRSDQAYNLMIGKSKATFDKADTQLSALAALNGKGADNAGNDAISTVSSSRSVLIVTMLIALAVGVALAVAIARSIAAPLAKTTTALGRISEGDLSVRLGLTRRDEVGEMSAALDATMDNLVDMMRRINEHADALAAASEELSATSKQMTSSAEESASTAQSVAGAAGDIAQNVQSMAAGSEQMSVSIEEIARNAQEASRVATEAVGTTHATTTTMKTLEDSAGQIGDVLALISTIAEQTNLLALNATIEAARAGDAGKGFAVVASEVKDLAQETARATEQITQQIQTIQNETQTAANGMRSVESVMAKIEDYTTSIAGAVEEQTATTGEMGRSATGVAGSADEVSSSVAVVASSAEQISASANATHDAASELARLSSDLRSAVGAFTLE